MTQRLWHYLDVSSGRFLCEDHGGFCDISDNFSGKCLIFDDKTKVTSNRIQRLLRLINGLQDRSKRSTAFSGTVLGFLSAAKLSGLMLGGSSLGDLSASEYFPFVFPFVTLAISTGLFAASMRHVMVTEDGQVRLKSMDEWEAKLVKELTKMETHHWLRNIAFTISVALLIILMIVRPS